MRNTKQLSYFNRKGKQGNSKLQVQTITHLMYNSDEKLKQVLKGQVLCKTMSFSVYSGRLFIF